MAPKSFRKTFAAAVLLGTAAWSVRADIVVVVHPDSPLTTVSSREVADLYLGRTRLLDGKVPALVIDQPADSLLRERFFQQLVGMNLKRVNAYWARLQFSGDTQPPQALADSQQVIAAVARNRQAIGYVAATAVDKSVRPILRIAEQ
jgi:ABC-type phosphate transport system substrate-binding protein